jgi:GNAT superfamily N-acetyltransferase
MINGDDSIEYVHFNYEYIDAVLEGLSNSFATHEITSIAQGLDKNDMKGIFGPLLKPNTFDYSFVALDRNSDNSNKVVGAIICLDFYKTLPLDSNNNDQMTNGREYTNVEFDDNKSGPIHQVISSLEEKYVAEKKANNELGENQILYQYSTYVEDDYKNKGIATKLYQMSEQNAINRGFKLLMTISSGPISQYIRQHKLNFTKVHQVDYKTFEYRGKKIFQIINVTPGCMLFEKKLK